MATSSDASGTADRGRFRGIGDGHLEDGARHLRPGSKPLLVIVDLQGLPEPDRVLENLRILMKPDRVVVLTAIGTVSPAKIRALGFQVLQRPIRIGSVVAAVARTIAKTRSAI